MKNGLKFAAIALALGALGATSQARPGGGLADAWKIAGKGGGGALASSGLQWKQMAPGVNFAPVYGDWSEGAHGKFVRIDKGANVPMHGHSGDYRAVMTSGRMANVYEDGSREEVSPGDSVHMPAKHPHAHECLSESGCTFYTHSDSSWDMLGYSEGGFHLIIPDVPDEASAD